MRAIDADGAELEQLHLTRQFEDLDKGGGDRGEVVAPERANRVVVRMRVSAEVTHRDVAVACPFDPARTEDAVGVTVDQKRQEQMRRILLVAAALGVDRKAGQRQPLDRSDDKVHQIVLADPIAQIRRQQHRGVAVNVFETLRHEIDAAHRVPSSARFRKKSPTGS